MRHLIVAAIVLLSAGPTCAQEMAPKPVLDPHARTHDGFYLRLGLGYGWISATNTGPDPYLDSSGQRWSEPPASVENGGVALDLLVGGTLGAGVVVGASLMSTRASTVEVGGERYEINGGATLTLVGPFVDVFFDPTAGFHAGGMVGYADLHLAHDRDETSPPAWRVARCSPRDDATSSGCGRLFTEGVGFGVFSGYDAFIEREWSMGGYARLLAFGGEQNNGNTHGWSLSLVATALYH